MGNLEYSFGIFFILTPCQSHQVRQDTVKGSRGFPAAPPIPLIVKSSVEDTKKSQTGGGHETLLDNKMKCH